MVFATYVRTRVQSDIKQMTLRNMQRTLPWDSFNPFV